MSLTEIQKAEVERARKFIENREKYWTNADPTGLGQRGLKWISKLNSNFFHLIFELLQNSDDVKYPTGVKPTLKIDMSRAGIIIFESNQCPFTEANVRALCDAGMSSKKGDAETTGEKGLGFKSVFRICDTVYIRSAGFSFSLARQGLRPVQPYWVDDQDFPLDATNFEKTYIILCLGNSDVLKPHLKKKLFKDIEHLEAQLLLFLRRIEQIEIVGESGSTRELAKVCRSGFSGEANRPVFRDIIEKSSQDPKAVTFSYVFHEYVLNDMPAEEARPGQKTTRIQLAFPCLKQEIRGRESWIPIMDSKCHVFAFLPLLETSFKFLLNADWITSTNREAVDVDNDWNLRIRDSLGPCFVHSIKKFINEHPHDLRYSSLRWIPNCTAAKNSRSSIKNLIFDSDDFFRTAAWNIIELLQQCEIVVTTKAELAKASDCLSLRSDFKFQGEPILSSANKSFAHRRYGEEDFVHLRTLGCMAFGKAEFVEALASVEQGHLDNCFSKFGARWFSQLFKALRSQARWTDKQLEPFRRLECVPSRQSQVDGFSLKRPDHDSLFMPSAIEEEQQKFDQLDSELCFVDIEAYSKSSEAELFLTDKLHVRVASCKELGEYILAKHQSAANVQIRRTISEFRRHLNHLLRYKAETNGDCKGVCALDQTGTLKPAYQLYWDQFGLLQQVFADCPSVHFIQSSLCTVEYLPLLLDNGLSRLPRLGSSELKYVMQSGSCSLQFLDLLTRCFSGNADVLGNGTDISEKTIESYLENQTFVSAMKIMPVPCIDGRSRPLQDTFFRSRVLENEPGLPFIDIDPLKSRQYRKILRRFGVSFDANLELRLKTLRQLGSSGATDCATITQVYKYLEQECRRASIEERQTLRKAFRDEPLVFLPKMQQWEVLEQRAFWSLSSDYKVRLDHLDLDMLSQSYGDRKELFSVFLQTRDLDIKDSAMLVKRNFGFECHTAPDMISALSEPQCELLSDITDQICNFLLMHPDRAEDWLTDLLALPFFLITQSGVLSATKNTGDLFFADDLEAVRIFKSSTMELKILDVLGAMIPLRRHIVEYINKHRPKSEHIALFSEGIHRLPEPFGEKRFDLVQSNLLRSHTKHIARYLYTRDSPDSAQRAIKRLVEARIYTVPSILENLSLEIGLDRFVSAEPQSINCMYQIEGDSLQIYMAVEDRDELKSIVHQDRLMSILQESLSANLGLREFLKDIWNQEEAKVEYFLRKQNICDLPAELAEMISRNDGTSFAEPEGMSRERRESSGSTNTTPSPNRTIKQEYIERTRVNETASEINVSEECQIISARDAMAQRRTGPRSSVVVVSSELGMEEDDLNAREPVPRAEEREKNPNEEPLEEDDLDDGLILQTQTHFNDAFQEADIASRPCTPPTSEPPAYSERAPFEEAPEEPRTSPNTPTVLPEDDLCGTAAVFRDDDDSECDEEFATAQLDRTPVPSPTVRKHVLDDASISQDTNAAKRIRLGTFATSNLDPAKRLLGIDQLAEKLLRELHHSESYNKDIIDALEEIRSLAHMTEGDQEV